MVPGRRFARVSILHALAGAILVRYNLGHRPTARSVAWCTRRRAGTAAHAPAHTGLDGAGRGEPLKAPSAKLDRVLSPTRGCVPT